MRNQEHSLENSWAPGAAVELDGGVGQRLEDAEAVRQHLPQPHGRGGDAGMAGQHHARTSFRARRWERSLRMCGVRAWRSRNRVDVWV